MEMLMWGVLGVIVAGLLGADFAVAHYDKKFDSMCKGEPYVMHTKDTTRTFTCEVKLKKGE